MRYFCGTRVPAISMVSHEISWWDISLVQEIQVIQVIQVIQLIQVMQVRLAHLWPDFRVISFCTYLAFSSTDKRIIIILLANFLNPEDRFDLEGTKHFFLLAFTGFHGFYILKQDPLIVQLFSFVDCIILKDKRFSLFSLVFLFVICFIIEEF